jgi:hypothetical protein
MIGLPPPPADPDHVRRLADEILRQRRYRQAEPGPIERVMSWITEHLGRLLGNLVGSGGGTIFAWVVLLAAVGGIALLLARTGRFTLPAAPEREQAEVMVELTRTPAEWRAEAERLEADGQWAAGLRCRHRALVGELVRAGAIREQAGRTAGEHLHDVARTRPDAAVPMAAATELFELAWYGGAPTGPAEAARFEELAGQVLAVRVAG